MTDLSSPVDADILPVRIVAQTTQMAELRAPDCAAVVVDRTCDPVMLRWIDRLDPEQLPRIRVVTRASAARNAALEAFQAAGTVETTERDALLDDIEDLARRFAEFAKTDWLRLRLDVITTNACRKFHIDAVTSRLVCTYRGSGTQYGVAAPQEMPQVIHAVPTGAPILLRGTLWPTPSSSRLVHRSPPIEGTGETRLVLVLDPVPDCEAGD